MSDKQNIFISYARKDGFAFSQIMRKQLEDEGFEVWQDLIAMNIGENWQPQLFKAIEDVDAVIMILTPASLQSAMVRQEWVHARRVGTPIFPVAFTDIYQETDVPRWLKKVDTVILDENIVGADDKLETLFEQLRKPPQRPRIPNMSPRLHDEYVERSRLQQQVIGGFCILPGSQGA